MQQFEGHPPINGDDGFRTVPSLLKALTFTTSILKYVFPWMAHF